MPSACRAGARPKITPVTSAMPNANSITRTLTARSRLRVNGKAGSDPASSDTSQKVSGTDTAAAATNSTRVSVSSWPNQLTASGADRQPRRHFAAPRRRARQQHAGDVAARNREQRAGQREQEADEGQERRAHRPGNASHARHVDGVVLMRVRLAPSCKLSLSVLSSALACAILTPGLRRPIATCHTPPTSVSRFALGVRARPAPSPSAPTSRCRSSTSPGSRARQRRPPRTRDC